MPYTHADGYAQRAVFADPILCVHALWALRPRNSDALGAFRGNKEKWRKVRNRLRKSVLVPEGPVSAWI